MKTFDHIGRIRDVSGIDVKLALLDMACLRGFLTRLEGLGPTAADLHVVVEVIVAYLSQDDHDTWTGDVRWASLSEGASGGTVLHLRDGPEAVGTLRFAVPFDRACRFAAERAASIDRLVWSEARKYMYFCVGGRAGRTSTMDFFEVVTGPRSTPL